MKFNTFYIKNIAPKFKWLFLKIIPRVPLWMRRFALKIIHFWLSFKGISLGIHLTDHCNLNCKCCDVFSPVAEPYCIDPEQLRSDLHQLHKIMGYKINFVNLAGGEPLLHPDIIKIINVTREELPNTEIFIISNGLLVSKMSDEFFEAVKANNITLTMTKYPINIDYNKLLKDISSKGIKCGFYSGETLKTMYRYPIDLTGSQNINRSFDLCKQAIRCATMREGKLFTCDRIHSIYRFNNYFDKNLEVTEDDYVDIYKVKSCREIMRKLSKPHPFCKNCKIADEKFGIPWSISKKEITEWADL